MKDKKILFGTFIALLLLLTTGLSYAYFSASISGNENAKNVVVEAGTLKLTYTDGPAINAQYIKPGWSTTKEVSVKNNGTLNTNYNVIRNHIEKYEKFSIKTIHDYEKKMNIRCVNNYLQFMEDMSDDYVQIDINTMLKKDKLNISSSELEYIKKSVDLILNNFSIINTENFKGYSLLPKIRYVWNKYLLIGILRTFYSDDYEIVNTGNKYSNTDFEVRRLNHV